MQLKIQSVFQIGKILRNVLLQLRNHSYTIYNSHISKVPTRTSKDVALWHSLGAPEAPQALGEHKSYREALLKGCSHHDLGAELTESGGRATWYRLA